MTDTPLPGSNPETVTSTSPQTPENILSKPSISSKDSETIQQFTQALEKSSLSQGKKNIIKGQLNTLNQLLASGSTESQQVMQSLKKTLSPLIKTLKQASTQHTQSLQGLTQTLDQNINQLTKSLKNTPHGMKLLKNIETAQKEMSLDQTAKGKTPHLPVQGQEPQKDQPAKAPPTLPQNPQTPAENKTSQTPQNPQTSLPKQKMPKEQAIDTPKVGLPIGGKEPKTPQAEKPQLPSLNQPKTPQTPLENKTPQTPQNPQTTLPKQKTTTEQAKDAPKVGLPIQGKEPQQAPSKVPQNPQTQVENKASQTPMPNQGKELKAHQPDLNKTLQQDSNQQPKGETEAKMPTATFSNEGLTATGTESVGKVNTTSRVDQAQNVEKVQQVIKQMVSHIQVMASKDMSQVSLSLNAPPELQGVEIKISTPSTSQNQLDIQFNHLTPDQQKFLEEHIQKNPNSQKQLSDALQPHGYTVNKMEVAQPTVANTDQGQGEGQDQDKQEDSSKQQQNEEEEEEENES